MSFKRGTIKMMTMTIWMMTMMTKKLYSMTHSTDLHKIWLSTASTDDGAKAKATAVVKVATVSVARVLAKVARARTDLALSVVASQVARIDEDVITMAARARVRAKARARKAKVLAQMIDMDQYLIFIRVLDSNKQLNPGLQFTTRGVRDRALDVISVAVGGTA